MKKKRIIILALLAAMSFNACNEELPAAAEYTPPPGSPLARNEHPRIFVTRKDLPALIQKINSYYRSDFQRFVSHMDDMYSIQPGADELDEWNEMIGAARSFAFLYLIDPASISGVRAVNNHKKYGKRALDIALYLASNLPSNWKEAHHGAQNLTTDKGGLASLALQVVYDWTHDLSSLEERRRIADRLMSMWNNRYDSRKVKLENHYGANVHVYAGALCFYGDSDLGSTYASKANEMMLSFDDMFLQRQLGVAEKIFSGSSGWIEGDSYSLDAFTGLMMMAAASGSAMGENYFASNSWLRYAPLFFYYNIMPKPYQNEFYFTQQNTSSVIEARQQYTSAIMSMAASQLANSDPQMSGFASWFIQQSPYGVKIENFGYNDPHLFDVFYKFLMGYQQVRPTPPDVAKIPLGTLLGQMYAARSSHAVGDATLVQFFVPTYWYDNGHNEQEQGAFNIHRFGTLAISAANSKNAGKRFPKVDKNGKGFVQNNVLGIAGGNNEMEPDLKDDGDRGKGDKPEHFYIGAPEHIGTVEALEYKNDTYDYINYNYSESYAGGSRASLARRALVYLRGPVNSEYVVVMDRVESPHEKYFVLHTPTDLMPLEQQWQNESDGHWSSRKQAVSVVNRMDDAHGQMYLTSVFPQNSEMHKFGGPGHEWVWADGTRLDYDPSRFSEKAAYLLSAYTLQIRSRENQFLSVMQIGDANSIGARADVQALSGNDWIGAYMGSERVVVFSKSETPLKELIYQIAGNKTVQHLITEVVTDKPFMVKKAGMVIAKGSTGANGTIAFTDTPGRNASYSIEVVQ